MDMASRVAIFPKTRRGRAAQDAIVRNPPPRMLFPLKRGANMASQSDFIAALCADAPAADQVDKLSLYGWLIGDWKMQTTLFTLDGTKQHGTGDIHFAWTLQGRAIQDVWIL